MNQGPSVAPWASNICGYFVLSTTTAPPFMTQRTLLIVDVYIRQRIAFDGDYIGEISWGERAEFLFLAE